MKKLIAFLLPIWASLVFAFADTVKFQWTPVQADLPFLLGYRISFGLDQFTNIVEIPPGATTATVEMPPYSYVILTAYNSMGESDPVGPLQYKPVIGMLVVQSTRLGPHVPFKLEELFRMDETLFRPSMEQLPTQLSITPNHLDIIFLSPIPRTGFRYPIDTCAYPDEFFRAFVVAIRP